MPKAPLSAISAGCTKAIFAVTRASYRDQRETKYIGDKTGDTARQWWQAAAQGQESGRAI